MYLPISKINPDKIFQYKKNIPNSPSFFGLEKDDKHYYQYITTNVFSNVVDDIPKDFHKVELSKEFIKKHLFDKERKLLSPNNDPYKQILNNNKHSVNYFIQQNSNKPFLVYINSNYIVNIYSPPVDKYYYYIDMDNYDIFPDYYINLVATYITKDILIGKSPKCEFTESEDAYGDEYDGNTILLYLGDFKYVYINENLYEFTTSGDIIGEYYSPISRNLVPYPFALSSEYIYFLAENKYMSRKIYDEIATMYDMNAYSYLYGQKGKDGLIKNITMKQIFNEIIY